jgi:hypothetical protein
MAAFRLGPPRRRRARFGRDLAQPGDRLEQPLAIAERDAELLEIPLLQIAQDVEADVVLDEPARVLAEPEVV